MQWRLLRPRNHLRMICGAHETSKKGIFMCASFKGNIFKKLLPEQLLGTLSKRLQASQRSCRVVLEEFTAALERLEAALQPNWTHLPLSQEHSSQLSGYRYGNAWPAP